jgi:hypothetical protein
VYSRTLEAAASARTRIERDFDPGAVRVRLDLDLPDEHSFGNAVALTSVRYSHWLGNSLRAHEENRRYGRRKPP